MENNNDLIINIWGFLDSLSEISPRFSSNSRRCRQDFIDFMAANNYFNIVKTNESMFKNEEKHQKKANPVFISQSDVKEIRPNIELWLRSYGTGSEEKLSLLTKRLITLFPKTGDMFQSFIEDTGVDAHVAWKLADYLCYALKRKIFEMDKREFDALAASMDKELPLFSSKMFSEFITYSREEGYMSNGWAYSFNSRREVEVEISAYSVSAFLKMAYIIFNEEAWIAERLIEKASQSERDANLWLFVSIHFICGWRGTDIVRIPKPSLMEDGAKIRNRILSGSLDADNIVNEIEFRLRYSPLVPQKTEAHKNVPELKLFVPETFRKPMGIIFAMAASYQESVKAGDPFIRTAGERVHLLSFFGRKFVDACDNCTFSSRRANKSYLQGIEMMSDNSSGRPKGYMLAALARSHKGGYGSLPKTTDIYLRDAKFSGYRPEFIAREMFEWGVFSFIPALMLEMYANDDYKQLPISFQTKLMAEIGIGASGLEGLAQSVDYALIKAKHAISNVMRYPQNIRGSVADILQNIASGNAPGKQEGFLCLMTATGSMCADAGRNCCIGCGYEIYTKTILHCLSKEYARLLAAKNKTHEPKEAERYTKILKTAVMPAIAEMFSSIKLLYPDADIKTMIDITELGAMLC